MQKVVRKYKLGEEPNDLNYWLEKSPEERLAALELLRERYITMFLNGIRPRLQRVYTITKRK